MKVIVFGDSISFGQYVSHHKTWVAQISSKLEMLGQELDHEIVLQCEAVNGRTTRMALETMPQEVQKHRPDIVMVQFGLNDCNYWDTDAGMPRVSRRAFGANMQEIVDRALNFGARKVFVNTNHPTTRNDRLAVDASLSYQESNESYNQELRSLFRESSKAEVELVDIEDGILREIESGGGAVADYILPPPDSLHLSQKGHDFYCRSIGQKIIDECRLLLVGKPNE